MFLSPYDSPFNCRADGSDCSDGLQKWLDAIAGKAIGILPPGVISYQRGLVVHGDTTVQGAGGGVSVLRNTAALPGSCISNEHLVYGTEQGPRLDRNISFTGVGFHGVSETPIPAGTGIDFLTFAGVDGLTLDRCHIAHRQLDGIVTANNVGMRITGCELFDLGTHTLPAQSGTGQFVGGSAIFCWRPSYRSFITGNLIHDCIGGGGIWMPINPGPEEIEPAESFTVTGNQIHNMVEFGIVGAPRGSVVSNNRISNIRRVDVSGHGAEMSGGGYSFDGNVISSIDGFGAFFFNPRDVSVRGNTITDVDRAKMGHTGIRLTSWAASAGVGPLPPRNVQVSGNVGNGGIDTLDCGGGAFDEFGIFDNQIGPVTIGATTSKRGMKFYVANN